jgi:hypothetical protein
MTFFSPSIVSSVWGFKNLGRNFGILMYAPFTGTPMFSYFYAFVSQSHAQGQGMCRGPECWQSTFYLTTVTSLLAVAIAATLWRQWRGRLWWHLTDLLFSISHLIRLQLRISSLHCMHYLCYHTHVRVSVIYYILRLLFNDGFFAIWRKNVKLQTRHS